MSPSPTVVLILERSEQVRKKLSEKESSYRIVEAEDLKDIKPREWAVEPDLLISDLRGMEGRGLSLYRQIRADPSLEAVPMLLLVPSAEASDASGPSALPLPESMKAEGLRQLVGHYLVTEGASSWSSGGVPFSEAVASVVEARLGDSMFTVEQLAEAVGLSRRQLTRRMKSSMGTTPAAFIRAQRLERAKELLAKHPETIAEVAEAVGFASQSAFGKAFRNEVGMTPSAYARQDEEAGP